MESPTADAPLVATPMLARAGGALIVASAALPLSPTGRAFWELVVEAFTISPLQGLIVAFGYGAPFWFGLCVLLAPADLGTRGPWSRACQWILGLMHAQLLLAAWILARGGIGMAAWPFLGFALVSGLNFAASGARFSADAARMDGAPPPGWWLGRWGAVMVVGICGWLRLQTLAGLQLGWALELAWLGGGMIAWQLTRTRPELPVREG